MSTTMNGLSIDSRFDKAKSFVRRGTINLHMLWHVSRSDLTKSSGVKNNIAVCITTLTAVAHSPKQCTF